MNNEQQDRPQSVGPVTLAHLYSAIGENGKAVARTTLNELYFILKNTVADLIEYRESEED